MIKQKIPVLPLRDIVVFPSMMLPLFVGRKKSIQAIEIALLADKKIVLTAQKKADLDDPQKEDLYNIGVLANIVQTMELPDSTIKVFVEGQHRCKIKRFYFADKIINAEIEHLHDQGDITPQIEALKRYVSEQFEKYAKLSRKIPHETVLAIQTIESLSRFSDNISAYLFVKVTQKQKLLATTDLNKRLSMLCNILEAENEILELEHKIRGDIKKQMEKSQKEYYLNEQMKAIQKELGSREFPDDIEELRKKILSSGMSKEALQKAQEELARLEYMPNMSPESAVLRNYIEWLIALPWKKTTKDILDIDRAETILNEDHFGLEKPKQRILEHLAVCKLVKKMKGPILCLVGPPGVGKTSLGRSIARSLGRNFVRISLGGIRDEAEIRGHRRTYIGSMPGRVIQSMKKAKSLNPVFLLDEVDKMSMDFRGDPSAALLEVLDPEQNNQFSDHYLEIPYDLSQVMFITTANVSYSIPPALKDRMEIIELPSYTEQEKYEIAKNFLIPKQIKAHGLSKRKPEFTKNAIYMIIREYTKEAGVRNLEREIGSICRKIAKQVATNKLKGKVIIEPKSIKTYLGVRKFHMTDHIKENQVGVATGLAWTEVGGDIMRIEATVMPGKGELTLTGNMGKVMQESAKAALSFARQRAAKLGLARDFYTRYDIHIHVPEGAIPKDGPSAGITIATAMISALTGQQVCGDVTMTGEITLTGKVLPVGGIKEKLLAARRANIKTALIPTQNQTDLSELPQSVTKYFNTILVDDMEQVLSIALVKP